MDNIWLSIDFYDEPKTKRLIEDCGYEAIVCLQKLWIMATKNAIRKLLDEDEIGLLDIESEKEIEKFTGWTGEAGKLSTYLIDKKWIDFIPNGSPYGSPIGSPIGTPKTELNSNPKNNGKFYIHKLNENNGYISNYIKLKVNGSKYAKKQWDKNKAKSVISTLPYGSPIGSPIGSPDGNVTERNITERNITNITTLSSNTLDCDNGSQKNDLIPYKKIIERFNEIYKTQFKIENQNTKNLIKARWNQGFRFEDFEKVMQKKINWRTDDKMVKYCRPQTIFGNKFESYLNEKEREIEIKKDYGGFV